MNHYLSLAFLLFSSLIARAQSCEDGIPADAFDRVLHREFSRIIDPSSNNNIGSFAALDLKDASVSLGASHTLKDSSILAVKFSGGTEDGVAAIWNDRNLSNNISAGLQYHFLWARSRAITYRNDSCEAFLAKYRKFREDSLLKRVEIAEKRAVRRIEWELRSMQGAVDVLVKKKEAHQACIDSLNAASVVDRGTNWNVRMETCLHKRDSLSVEIPLAQERLRQKQAELVRVTKENEDGRQVLKDWCDAERKKLPRVLAVDGVKLAWVSVGYSYNSSTFRLFNDSMTFMDQVTKARYGSHELRLQRNWYKRAYNTYETSYFVSVGASVGITDNHGDLDELKLEERKQQGPDSLSRTIVDSYTALTGEYHKDLLIGSVFADAYWFFSKNKSNAIHLFPSWTMMDMTTPSLNIGIGLLVGYVKKDNSANAVNIELFALFNDVANGAALEDSNASMRSDLGLRISFPFNFPQKP